MSARFSRFIAATILVTFGAGIFAQTTPTGSSSPTQSASSQSQTTASQAGSASTGTTSTGTASTAALQAPAVPYSPDEFKGWMLDLRRFEIIGFGSVPFTLFFTRFGFDSYKYFSNGELPQYAPWPFKKDGAYVPTSDEAKGIALTAIGVSVVFAFIDLAILKLRKKKPKTDAITVQDILKMQAGQNAGSGSGS